MSGIWTITLSPKLYTFAITYDNEDNNTISLRVGDACRLVIELMCRMTDDEFANVVNDVASFRGVSLLKKI